MRLDNDERWVLGGAIVALLVVAVAVMFGVKQDNAAHDRCAAAGGETRSRSTGFTTTIINGHPYLQPTSENYCVVDGREVRP